LEAKLTLEKVVQGVGVCTSIAVVDLLVRAHNGTSSSTNSVCKRPKVQLVHSDVVHIRAQGFGDVETVASGFWCLAEVLLFIDDVVLSACIVLVLVRNLDRLGHIQAMTPASWIPLTVCATAIPESTGSGEKPSQFRPPSGALPSGPTTGPS
jgi:hypothetical protein